MVHRRLVAILVSTVALTATTPAQAPTRETENLAAFTRLYGVVRYFYPSDAAAALDWDAFAIHGVRRIRTAANAASLETELKQLFGALGPGIEIARSLSAPPPAGTADATLVAWRYVGPAVGPAPGVYRGKRTNREMVVAPAPPNAPTPPPFKGELVPETPPVTGAHVDVELGAGLRARVPLALSDEAAASAMKSAQFDALKSALGALQADRQEVDVDTRLADVVVAWSVFRQFYPYWKEAGVDWETRLAPLLEAARPAATRPAHRDRLRRLVADVRDGHGNVIDPRQTTPPPFVPVRLAIAEGQVVVTSSGSPESLPVGAVVTAVDGNPSMKRITDLMELASGTTQWKQTRALREIATCDGAAARSLTVDNGRGGREVSVPCGTVQPPAEPRPQAVGELSDGIWYVDITRATMAQITPVLESLAKAPGVVFDLRGYPTDSGSRILPHLFEAAEQDRWMHIAKIVGPFGQYAGWHSVGWNVAPQAPRLSGRIVFMTDGRAISYSESVMGYIKDRKLATVVGSSTAGANGNVVRFTVPSGLAISFTGMRVTGHDGAAQLHLIGVPPDIPVSPTIAGIRQNRDEVLERALAVAKTGR